ncbi:hypothetical protein ACN08X_01960 [Rothia sp. P6271]
MAKKLPPITEEEFSELIRHITKRMLIGGAIAILIGVAIIAITAFFNS